MKMIPPDTVEPVAGKALIGVDLLDQASNNLDKLQDIESQLFMLTEQLLGAEPTAQLNEDRLNFAGKPHESFATNLTDCHLRQRDTLASIEHITRRLREFI